MTLLSAFLGVLYLDRAVKPPRPHKIAPRPTSAKRIGRGFIDPRQREGTRRIALTLDQPTFDRVRDCAAKKRISFAAAARELIAAGADAMTAALAWIDTSFDETARVRTLARRAQVFCSWPCCVAGGQCCGCCAGRRS